MSLLPKVEFDNPAEIALTNQDTLRKTVGILGMLLPILLYLTLWTDLGHTRTLESISHYYLTRAGGVFVIIVSLLAIFLIVYKGRDRIDFYASTFAGACALLLLLFPTSNISEVDCCSSYAVTQLKVSAFRPKFHLIAAALFLLTLALMSLFLFTRSKHTPEVRGKQKRRRNRIFRTMGVIMILALLTIVAGFFLPAFQPFYEHYRLTFWMETAAVEAFGFAWFVKGEAILKDRNTKEEPEEVGSTVVMSPGQPVNQ